MVFSSSSASYFFFKYIYFHLQEKRQKIIKSFTTLQHILENQFAIKCGKVINMFKICEFNQKLLIKIIILLIYNGLLNVNSEWVDIPQMTHKSTPNIFSKSNILKMHSPFSRVTGIIEGPVDSISTFDKNQKVVVLQPKFITGGEKTSNQTADQPIELHSHGHSLVHRNGVTFMKKIYKPSTSMLNEDTWDEKDKNIDENFSQENGKIESNEERVEKADDVDGHDDDYDGEDDDGQSVTVENDDEDFIADSVDEDETNSKPTPLTQRTKPTKRKIYKLVPKPSPSHDVGFSFIDFLKDIQKSFVHKTVNTIQDKIQMLQNYRDNLLINIEDRIKSVWPVSVITTSKEGRKKRSMMVAQSDGQISFPSAEGALITICFLTFAVFLIKLVLVSDTIK